MGKRNKIKINQNLFKKMDREALIECSHILGIQKTRLIKGGIISELSSNELRSAINRCLSQGTFPDRISRLAAFLEDWFPSNTTEKDEVDPQKKVMELIEDVRSSFESLSNLQMLEIIAGWIENPQGSCDYEELDYIAEELGFNYEEINGEFVLVFPSPDAIATKVLSMSDGDFYHFIIKLAALALPTERYFDPPGISCAGYAFLSKLAAYFKSINK